jgi:hypothetical protein
MSKKLSAFNGGYTNKKNGNNKMNQNIKICADCGIKRFPLQIFRVDNNKHVCQGCLDKRREEARNKLGYMREVE